MILWYNVVDEPIFLLNVSPWFHEMVVVKNVDDG